MNSRISYIIVASMLTCLSTSSHSESDTQCIDIKLSRSGLLITTVSATGPRGTLNFPAIIDTGAANSFIPRSIADGIGYSAQHKETFITGAGPKEFNTIVIRLNIGSLEFPITKVGITEPESTRNASPFPVVRNDYFGNRFLNSTETKQSAPRSHDEAVEKELAVIGMSELSETTFTFSSNMLKICRTPKWGIKRSGQ